MRQVLNVITFPLSILYWIVFFLILIIFHGLQWLAFNLFGYRAHKKVVDLMNFFLVKSFLLVGVRYKISGNSSLTTDEPTIIVSNHQSMFDIPPLIWYLRVLHPKFVAKKELSKGVPGISYNLRHGGSVLIDRKDRDSAVQQIKNMGDYIKEHNRSVVIFPEGTRSETGVPRKWKSGGLITLFEKVPTANILPVTIKGSWKVLRHKGWPIPFGTKIEVIVHDVMQVGDLDVKSFIESIQYIVEKPLSSLS